MKTPFCYRAVRAAIGAGALWVIPAATTSACVQGYSPGAHLEKGIPASLPLAIDPRPPSFNAAWSKVDPTTLSSRSDSAGAKPGQDKPKESDDARLAREFEAKPLGTFTFEDATNYAVALIRLARPADAIHVLLKLESIKPGVYTTAANLGTAYELNGELESAVKWIGDGIIRNPHSHQGTEWLHLAILRAKLELRADPTWLAKHSVLDFATRRDAPEITRAIDYQLKERLFFVKPQDAVVCDLFYQAALRTTHEQAKERRAEYLRESLRFGDWRKAEIEALAKS